MNLATSTNPVHGEQLEEGEDSFLNRFDGPAGYQVLVQGEHGRSWIELVYDSEQTAMKDSILNSCPGTWPNKADDEIYWRGFQSNGELIPYALIVRMASVPSEDQPEKKAHTFIIIQTAGAGSRVVGAVPESEGFEAAEKLADELCKME